MKIQKWSKVMAFFGNVTSLPFIIKIINQKMIIKNVEKCQDLCCVVVFGTEAQF